MSPGLCLAHLGRHEEADVALSGLRTGEEVTAAYPDLTLDVGCALATMGQHARALDYLWRLLVGVGGGGGLVVDLHKRSMQQIAVSLSILG